MLRTEVLFKYLCQTDVLKNKVRRQAYYLARSFSHLCGNLNSVNWEILLFKGNLGVPMVGGR